MKFSNSSLDKYRLCPKMYDLHYNERIRPDVLPSPLFFGSAIDEALNSLLLRKKKVLTLDEAVQVGLNPLDVFDKRFSHINFNGEDLDVRRNPKATYMKIDFDIRLLNDEDWAAIKEFTECDDIQKIKDFLKYNVADMSVEDLSIYNYIQWLSLRRRGHLFIDKYEKTVLPRIVEVISIQRETKLTNAENDTYIGFIDFIGVWDDGETYIFDNKTSSRKYSSDSVSTSTQLMTYSEDTGISRAGYIVMLKELTWNKHNTCKSCGFVDISRKELCPKKCGKMDFVYEPVVNIQIVLDEINENNKEKMFTDIQGIADNIKGCDFSPNWNTCARVFGRKCPYFDYCRNGSMDGLVKVKEGERK